MRTVRRQGCRQIHSLNHKQKNDWQAEETAALGNGKFRVWVWKEGREAAKQPVATDGNRSSSKTKWNEGAGQQLRCQSYGWNIITSVCCTPTAQRKQELNLLSPSCVSSLSISQINKPPNARTHTSFHPKQDLGVLSPGNQLCSRVLERKWIPTQPCFGGKGRFGKSKTILTPASFIKNLGLVW